jgi:hypothetical protein
MINNFNKREEKIIQIAEKWDDSNFIKQIILAFMKYAAFVTIAIFVLTVIFRNLVEVDPFAFALMISVLIIYELKGREITFISVIRKLQNQIKESQSK